MTDHDSERLTKLPRPIKSDRMRILELIDSLDTGGAERMVSCLALSLQERGNTVTVACLRDFGCMAVPEETFRHAGVRLIELRKPEGFSINTLRRLVRYAKEGGFDVIHTHNPLVNHYGVAAAFGARIPVVVQTLHGIQTLEMSRLGKFLYQSSCLLTDKVVGVCGAVESAFQTSTGLTKGKTTVIDNGIDLGELLTVPPRRPEGEFVFGAVGRLVPVKNHRLLLDAFASACRDNTRCRLAILGTGELDAELREQAKALGVEERVHLRGWSSNVAGFLEEIDAFVLSSSSEGLPMTVLEAMAAARPIISTAVGGVPELVEGSNCGWLCEPNNPEALADVMHKAMTSELLEKGARGRSYVVRRFSAERMAEEYEALFRGLLRPLRFATRSAENAAETE